MQLPTQVQDFYDNFDVKKNYGYFIFIAGNPLQSAELNEYQDTVINQQKLLETILLENGTVISGGDISVNGNNVSISESFVFTNKDLGFISYLPSTQINISKLPTTVGLYVQRTVITGSDDQSLLEPYTESPNYNEDGAYRVKYFTSFISEDNYNSTNGSSFIPIAVINEDKSIYYIANEGNLNVTSFLKRLNTLDKGFNDLKNRLDNLETSINNINPNNFYLKSGDDLSGDMRTNANKLIASNYNSALQGIDDIWHFKSNYDESTVKINASQGNIELRDANSYFKADNYYAYNSFNFRNNSNFYGDVTINGNLSTTGSMTSQGSIVSYSEIKLLTQNVSISNNYIRTNALWASLSPSRPANLTGYMFFEEEVGKEVRWVLQASAGSGSEYYFKFSQGGRIDADTFNGTATRAKYGDLAEYYIGDKKYSIGTLLKIGGVEEVTETTKTTDVSIGVISEKPGLIINSEIENKPNANLTGISGKVKIRVVGKVEKGDFITPSNIPGVGIATKDSSKIFLAISFEDNDKTEEKLVYCIIHKG